MRRLDRLCLMLWCFCVLQAAPTNIVDVLLQPTGNPQTPVGGMDITISQTAFVSGNNYYPGFTLTPHPVSDSAGNVNLWLEPNVTGQLYQVLFRATNGVITRECWNVPTSGTPLRIKDVRSTLCTPTANLVVQLGQLARGGALDRYVATFNLAHNAWEAAAAQGGVPAGTSGGVAYYDSATTIASTPAWTLNAVMVGGGAGQAPMITAMTYDPFLGGGRLTVPGNVNVGGSINAFSGGVNADILVATETIAHGVYKVADLPNCSFEEGKHAGATDLLAPTFLGVAVGNGTVHGPVYCNGTNWIVE